MSRRKSILGIMVLCALALSAFIASTASAEERAYGCQQEPNAEWTWGDAHCFKSMVNKTGQFETRLFEKGKETAITGTNENTAEETKAKTTSKLHGNLAGVETEVQCTGLEGTGQLTNAESSVTGTGTINYTGCSVTKPAGKGCVVTGGAVTTKTLKGTTVGLGKEAGKLKFEPNSGTEFATVPIEKCSIGSLNNKFPVTGSVIGVVTGATTTTTGAKVTEENTLKFGGVKAGIEGALTIKNGSNGVVLMEP